MMLRLGQAQIHNHFEIDSNLKEILTALKILAAEEVELLLFPECVVTGFNTGLLKLDEAAVLNSINRIQSEIKTLGTMTVALPTPWPTSDGKFFNSVLIINSNGEIAQMIHKTGLNKGEDRIFASGPIKLSRCFELNGIRIGVIICVEATHEPWAYLDQADKPDLILWPGFYADKMNETWSDANTESRNKIIANLNQWKVPLWQTTCASSPEAQHWPGQAFGGSLVLDFQGRPIATCKRGQEDHITAQFDGQKFSDFRTLVHASQLGVIKLSEVESVIES